MFNIHEVVMHNTLGICEVRGIEQRSVVGRPAKEYYILHSLYDEDNTAFVPVEGCERLMRFPMQKTEIIELIEEMPNLCSKWIDETRARKDSYTQTIREGNPHKLVAMIRSLYLKDEERKKIGKRINDADARQQAQAIKILHQEMAYGLGIGVDEVPDAIHVFLEQSQKRVA